MQFKPTQQIISQLQSYCRLNGIDTITAINQLIGKQLELETLDHDYLLAKYKSIADFNILDIAEWDGESLIIRPSSEWPDSCKGKDSPIASISMGLNGVVLKAHDKLKAQDAIAKHLGLFGDFNVAIGTLKKYGIVIVQNVEGEWEVQGQTNPIQLGLVLD
jgi:hypothetical protein